MTPHPTTPLQASFTVTPLPIHHPFPSHKNFDHTLFSTDASHHQYGGGASSVQWEGMQYGPVTSSVQRRVCSTWLPKLPRVNKSTVWRWYHVCPKRWLKTAKSCQCLSPKSVFFSLLLQLYQGWLFKSKSWLMSQICQPLSLVSGF